MSAEAILMHFEAIFACETRFIVQKLHESHRLVGNGYIRDNRRINMHVFLHILEYMYVLRKAVFDNFIRKRFVGILFDFIT